MGKIIFYQWLINSICLGLAFFAIKNLLIIKRIKEYTMSANPAYLIPFTGEEPQLLSNTGRINFIEDGDKLHTLHTMLAGRGKSALFSLCDQGVICTSNYKGAFGDISAIISADPSLSGDVTAGNDNPGRAKVARNIDSLSHAFGNAANDVKVRHIPARHLSISGRHLVAA
jgi:hypothetical protein